MKRILSKATIPATAVTVTAKRRSAAITVNAKFRFRVTVTANLSLEERVLPHARYIAVRRDYRLGGYFCKLFGLRLVFQLALGFVCVHVLVDEIKHIVTAAAGRVTKINNRNLVSVIFLGDGRGVSIEVALAVGCPDSICIRP